jgi:hypothetical protein
VNEEKSEQETVTNPRSKKKKEIRYDESLRRVLKNTRYSHLYNMLLDAYQMTYLHKGSKKSEVNSRISESEVNLRMTDKENNEGPLPDRRVPFVYITDHYGIHSIFNYPLSPDDNQEDPASTRQEIEGPVHKSKKRGQALHEKRVQERLKNNQKRRRLKRIPVKKPKKKNWYIYK